VTLNDLQWSLYVHHHQIIVVVIIIIIHHFLFANAKYRQNSMYKVSNGVKTARQQAVLASALK